MKPVEALQYNMFTDRSKTVLLLWIIYCISEQCEVGLFFVFRYSFSVIRFSFFFIRFSLFDFRFDIQNPILTFEIAPNIIF